MTDTPPDPVPEVHPARGKPQVQHKVDRRAAALKANMARRKAQARARAGGGGGLADEEHEQS